jgi:hypothetical protein
MIPLLLPYDDREQLSHISATNACHVPFTRMALAPLQSVEEPGRGEPGRGGWGSRQPTIKATWTGGALKWRPSPAKIEAPHQLAPTPGVMLW